MNYEVYIENKRMDVDEQTSRIATTLQHFDFLNIGQSVKANRTNRISLPLTPNNLANLEQVAPLSVITTKPYSNLSIRIVNGANQLPVGVCQIKGIKDRISLDVQSTLKSFFEAIDGKYLNDIDLSAYNGVWSDSVRDSVRNTSAGLICPVVHTGQFVNGAASAFVDLYSHGRANVPFFFYSTIIDKIFTLAGFTKSGDVFTDPRYLAMIMSTRLVFNEQWLKKKEFKAAGAGQDLTIPFTYEKILFSTVLGGNEDGYFSTSTSQYKPINADTSAKYFRGRFIFTCKSADLLNGANFQVALNSVGIGTSEFHNDGESVRIVTDNVSLKHNDVVEAKGQCLDGGDVTISDCLLTFVAANTTDTDLTQETDWYLYYAQLLPRILLKDFIKDFMVMFGLVMREADGNIEFKHINDILGQTEEVTTEELEREDASQQGDKSYAPSGWAQENEYLWQVQEDEEIITEDYGRGTIDIENETLPPTSTRHTSLFTASDSDTVVRIRECANFEIYDQGGSEFTKAASFGFRLLLTRPDDGIPVRFVAGTSRSDYKIGYFIDPIESQSMDFQEIIEQYYPLYRTALNRYLRVTKPYFITYAQLCASDLFKLKHRDGISYLVESVDNFIPDSSTKFQMIRV